MWQGWELNWGHVIMVAVRGRFHLLGNFFDTITWNRQYDLWKLVFDSLGRIRKCCYSVLISGKVEVSKQIEIADSIEPVQRRTDGSCGVAKLIERRASNWKVAKPWCDSRYGSASLCPWKRYFMPFLGQAVYPSWQLKKTANRAVLCWSDVTGTEHNSLVHSGVGARDAEKILANLEKLGKIWLNLGKIWLGLGKNQNFASPKTFDFLIRPFLVHMQEEGQALKKVELVLQ